MTTGRRFEIRGYKVVRTPSFQHEVEIEEDGEPAILECTTERPRGRCWCGMYVLDWLVPKARSR